VEPDPISTWEDMLTPRTLRREIDRLFEDFFSPTALAGGARQFVPTLEAAEADKEYVVRVELPGMTEGDVQVEIDEDNRLVIRGEKKSETSQTRGGFEYTERSFGQFTRVVQLPSGVDASKVDATFQNGVLELHVPKTAQARARAIPIASSKAEPKKTEEEVIAAGKAEAKEPKKTEEVIAPRSEGDGSRAKELKHEAGHN